MFLEILFKFLDIFHISSATAATPPLTVPLPAGPDSFSPGPRERKAVFLRHRPWYFPLPECEYSPPPQLSQEVVPPHSSTVALLGH